MGAWMGDTPRTPTSKLVTASGVTRRSPPAAGSTQLMLWWPKLPALCKSTLGSKKKYPTKPQHIGVLQFLNPSLLPVCRSPLPQRFQLLAG